MTANNDDTALERAAAGLERANQLLRQDMLVIKRLGHMVLQLGHMILRHADAAECAQVQAILSELRIVSASSANEPRVH